METSFLVIFTFLLLQRFGSSISTTTTTSSNVTCIEGERESLLIVKQKITDKSNRLSTWSGVECCEWHGVGCDGQTGHVVKLDLRTPGSYEMIVDSDIYLEGELSPSLQNLKHLHYLDLSFNCFHGNIPVFLGSFERLEYLNISFSCFGGVVPHHLGNLSRLQYLDLRSGVYLKPIVDDLRWVSSLSSLRYLDLSGTHIGNHTDWFHPVNMLPSFVTHFVNFTSLNSLDLSINYINSTIPLWLSNFTDLMHLNLYSNRFHGKIPDFIGSFSSLDSIELSFNSFETLIPDLFCNLSSLVLLDLSRNMFFGPIPSNLGLLSRLQYLHLYSNRLSGNIPMSLLKLSNLKNLDLSNNSLAGVLSETHFTKLKNLNHLGLSLNQLALNLSSQWVPPFQLQTFNARSCNIGPHFPNWLHTQTNLQGLDLSNSSIKDTVPEWFQNILCHFSYLDLFFNQLHGNLPQLNGDCSKLSSLVRLDLSFNMFSGPVPSNLGLLSGLEELNLRVNQLSGNIPMNLLCNLSSLVRLDLSGNMFSGPIPSNLGLLSRLEELNLGNNQLSGNIPMSLWQLSNLKNLDLARNSLAGVLSETHFMKLKNLNALDLSLNQLALNLSSQWVPPFQLQAFAAGSCNIGPHFPNWLHTQTNLKSLDLSNSSIKDTVPDWFDNIMCQFYYLDLSNNQLYGKLPQFHGNCSNQIGSYSNLMIYRTLKMNSNNFEGSLAAFPSDVVHLDLSDNLLEGDLPQTGETMNPTLQIVILSKNRFAGSIPVDLCKVSSIRALDLSQNKLSGRLPECLGNLSRLRAMDLSNNSITGVVPTSLGSLTQLSSLHLQNNRFEGNLPLSFQNLTSLIMLDIGYNFLVGNIPFWNGENLLNLRFLNLQSNNFTGKIPLTLCQLKALQYLNLAQNNVTGTIPYCFGSLSGMITNQAESGNFSFIYYIDYISTSMKGIQLVYTKTISFLTSLDLSSNNITGEIPDFLTNLVGLKSLNLSRNQLKGQIPMRIGNLNHLESLDFSLNKLSGRIPQSLTSLNFLSYLNLSFNNLSGPIPVGNQLQTLSDSSAYKGNDGLCGPPISKSCKGNNTSYKHANNVEAQDDDDLWFYSGIGPGFFIGFLGLVGSLHFIRRWRVAFFEIHENVYGWLSLLLLLNLARLRRMFL